MEQNKLKIKKRLNELSIKDKSFLKDKDEKNMKELI